MQNEVRSSLHIEVQHRGVEDKSLQSHKLEVRYRIQFCEDAQAIWWKNRSPRIHGACIDGVSLQTAAHLRETVGLRNYLIFSGKTTPIKRFKHILLRFYEHCFEFRIPKNSPQNHNTVFFETLYTCNFTLSECNTQPLETVVPKKRTISWLYSLQFVYYVFWNLT